MRDKDYFTRSCTCYQWLSLT